MSFSLFVILLHFSYSRPKLYGFMMNRVNVKGNKQNRGRLHTEVMSYLPNARLFPYIASSVGCARPKQLKMAKRQMSLFSLGFKSSREDSEDEDGQGRPKKR